MVEVEPLVQALGADARILQIDDRRPFDYESVYFDTPDLTSYLLAAHRRRRRFKIRTRTYLDSAECWLEVKTRDKRGHTVKYRRQHDGLPAALTPDGRDFTDLVVTNAAVPGAIDLTLAPTLVTSYRRSTLYLPATDSRVTIDTDLHWELDTGQHIALPEMAIVETKTVVAGLPGRPVALAQRPPSHPDLEVRDRAGRLATGPSLDQMAPHPSSALSRSRLSLPADTHTSPILLE